MNQKDSIRSKHVKKKLDYMLVCMSVASSLLLAELLPLFVVLQVKSLLGWSTIQSAFCQIFFFFADLECRSCKAVLYIPQMVWRIEDVDKFMLTCWHLCILHWNFDKEGSGSTYWMDGGVHVVVFFSQNCSSLQKKCRKTMSNSLMCLPTNIK